MTTKRKILLGLSLCAMGATASAGPVYDYQRGSGTFGGNGMSYDSVSASYDSGNGDFSFEVDFGGTAADGGWLVVSPGPNPKSQSDELGIAYFDRASGDVWIYAYNGQNNAASYAQTPFLAFFEDAYTTVGDVGTLSFNASAINNQLETGFAFGERIGIWYHPSTNVTAFGDANGLDSFSAGGNGWLDTNYDGDCTNPNTGCITITVPEPGSLPLLLAGAGIMILRRRATKTAN